MMAGQSSAQSASIPAEPLGRLFSRFLKFGLLAWGGPVAQIAMIRQELVEEERWIAREDFNRVLAMYQVLPGPEAHELCVYFGMRSRGRLGGLLAGLGFMLPGFVLMFLLSAFYITGVQSSLFQAFLLGLQPAVVALIVRAVHRIGQHALTDRWLWGIAFVAVLAQLRGTSFWITLPLAGLLYLVAAKRQYLLAALAAIALLASTLFLADVRWTSRGVAVPPSPALGIAAPPDSGGPQPRVPRDGTRAPLPRLFVSGLRSGLLTFGGAYTVLPFLQNDAVMVGRWMTNEEFLDGVALSGILPAPFIIFSTFVGYLGGGSLGALVLTIGIFFPAFAFTLVGHRYVEQLITNERVHNFLDGVTAGVVGMIAATAFTLFRVGVRDLTTLVIFGLTFGALYAWKAKGAVAVVVLGAGVFGLLLFR